MRLSDAAESILAPRLETSPRRRPSQSHHRWKATWSWRESKTSNSGAELKVTMVRCFLPITTTGSSRRCAQKVRFLLIDALHS